MAASPSLLDPGDPAERIARHLDARRTGAGRWMASCPAHDDSSPSLSIASGRDVRVLLHCWAGCSLDAVLKASGLTMRDLFAGEPPTPQQVALWSQAREAKAARERRERRAYRQAWQRVRRLEAIVNALGGKLAQKPDDAELGRLFHRACDRLHEVETTANEKRPAENGPLERNA